MLYAIKPLMGNIAQYFHTFVATSFGVFHNHPPSVPNPRNGFLVPGEFFFNGGPS